MILGLTYEFSCGYESARKITGLEEEDDEASVLLWPIQIFAHFFFISGILTCYPILLLLLNILTDEAWWLSGSGVCPMTNRTWVRIPGPPCICYIFSTGYPVQIQARDASYSLIQSMDRWPQARSDDPDGTSTIESSQRRTLNLSKSARPAPFGPSNCCSDLQIRPKPPLSLSISFFTYFI